MTRAGALAGLLTAALAAGAAALSTGAAAQSPQRATVEQKEALVRKLLTDAPIASRIAAADNDEARKLIAAAAAHHGDARRLLGENALREADARLNEAMWAIGRARQLVPDNASRAIEQRVRYRRLMESVEGIRASYERHLSRSLGLSTGTPLRDAALDESTARLEEARTLLNAERLHDATQALERAEQVLLVGLNRVLGSTTLDYAPKFDTPADEYAHEMDRNRSFLSLVPVALHEFRPTIEAMQLVNRYVESNTAQVGLASRHAERREWRDALRSLRQGTTYLQRALGAAGLAVPQAPTD